ncbi:Opsin Rh1, partial [Gryllus bimaculatus]
MEAEGDDAQLPMAPWAYAAAAAVLALIGFFGFSLNLIVILLFVREKQLRTPMNMVLLNLAVSDLCVATVGNPLTMTAAVVRRWPFGPKLCVAYAFFMSFFGMASIGALALLALERFLLVAHSLRRAAPSLRHALCAVGGVWVYALALSAPPLAGWGAFGPEAANISCSVNWEKPDLNSTTYIAFLFALGLALPVGIICGCYVGIVRIMRKSAVRAGRSLPRAERRLTLLVLVMAAAFLAAWTPYAALALASAAARRPVASPAVAVLPALLAKSSVCYNPVIYVGLNSQ